MTDDSKQSISAICDVSDKQTLKYAKDFAQLYKNEKRRRKELQVANETIMSVIDSMTDGMLATDENNNIIQVNEVSAELFEMDKKDLPGKDLVDIFKNIGIDTQFFQQKEHPDFDEPFTIDAELPGQRMIRIVTSKIINSKGHVVILHDITSEKRADELKSEFLSLISHELKTPLNAILGFSDLLIGTLDSECATYAESIHKAGMRMNNALDELVTFAKLQSGRDEAEDEGVNIYSHIQYALSNLEGELHGKNITCEFDDGSKEFCIKGKKKLLYTLFSQIIHNAILFGKQDGHITVKIVEDDEYHNISIMDDGIGIPASDLNKVFNSFYQVEQHLSRSHEGLGLGLSLSKRIVEQHSGSISMDSKINEGTTVLIRLPKHVPIAEPGKVNEQELCR